MIRTLNGEKFHQRPRTSGSPLAIRVGKRIAAIRLARGLSQRDLATRLNAMRTLISKWENGRSEPMPDSINKLACVLAVNPGELLCAPIGQGKSLSLEPFIGAIAFLLPGLNAENRSEILAFAKGMV